VVKQKFKAGITAVRKRATGLKLAREVSRLTAAVDGEYETLGTLMLIHRPETPDVSTELAALSQIQNEISQKEATHQALRQTEGRGPVAKELVKELAELREAQRRQMIAIGEKAAQARADMPGTAAHYDALARLQASLQTKQAELDALKQELGPLLDGASFSAQSLRRPAIIAGCVVVGVLVLYFGWTALSGLFAPRLPTWVAQACPKDTEVIVYVDMQRVRDSELWESLEGKIDKDRGSWGELGPDDIAAFAFVKSNNGEFVFLETEEDLSLVDLFKNPPEESKIKTKNNTEYVEHEGQFVAKIGKNRYLLCPHYRGNSFRDALKRIEKKESPKFDKDLQRALDEVVGEDCYAATTEIEPVIEKELSLRGLRAVGCGASFGSKVVVCGTLVFRNKRNAKNFHEDYADLLEEWQEKVEKVPRRRRRQMEQVLEWAEEIRVRQSGSLVRLSGKWDFEDIEEFDPGEMDRLF